MSDSMNNCSKDQIFVLVTNIAKIKKRFLVVKFRVVSFVLKIFMKVSQDNRKWGQNINVL